MMRSERFEIDVAASRDEVWRLLTTAEGLASWFGTTARIDLRVHGERTVAWGDEIELSGRVDEVDPPSRLRIVYEADGREVGAEEWLIATTGTTTRVTLVNSMVDDDVEDWEGFYGDIRRGWRLFLASMEYCLDGAGTPSRTVECRHIPAPGTRQEVWGLVSGVLTARPDLVAGMRPVVVDPPHSRLFAGSGRSLLLDIEGAGSDRVLYAQAARHDGADLWITDVLDAVGGAVDA